MDHNQTVHAFLKPDFYDHGVDQIELIETHISWVFLTGSYAYKIKKPVDFGFLDFTTLERRKLYCDLELKLNRRYAPQIYLEVLPVTEANNDIQLNGKGKIIDYVVKMKQFKQQCLFNRLIKADQINLQHIEKLSHQVARFHQQIKAADYHVNFGSTDEVLQPVEENFTILNQIITGREEHELLQFLYQKMYLMFQAVYDCLIERKRKGYIRECHGDLHLKNIALVDDEILLFDGIEFNDSLRWIDTMSDCAFLIMDLEDHQCDVLANHFLNTYLSVSGDYSGLSVLNFYKFYRATVRAKVAALNLQQHSPDSSAYHCAVNDLNTYLTLAEKYTHKHSPFLTITYGVSGSGKSWLSSNICDVSAAILLRSDIERKRLFSGERNDLYTKTTTDKTYAHLFEHCEMIIKSGYSVVVDATFSDKQKRQQFQRLANELDIPFYILSCSADEQIIEERLLVRQNDKNDPSDADLFVMKKQQRQRDPLDGKELPCVISVDTGKALNYQTIAEKLNTSESLY